MVIRKCDKCKQNVGPGTNKELYRTVSCSLNKPVKDAYGAFLELNESYILCSVCYEGFKVWKDQ